MNLNENFWKFAALGGIGVGLLVALTRAGATGGGGAGSQKDWTPIGEEVLYGGDDRRPPTYRRRFRDVWGRVINVIDTGLAGEESGAQDYNDVYYDMCWQPDGSYAPCAGQVVE